MEFSRAREVLQSGREAHAFPAAVCEVGRGNGALWTEAFGRLTYDADAPVTTVDTVFDLASLTKVITTTSIVIDLMRRDLLTIDTPVADVFGAWRGGGREAVTVGHLLDHSAGLPAQLHLSESARTRSVALAAILNVPLERPPGTMSVYSDVGFMLLGFLLEAVGGRPLDVQWNALWEGRPTAGDTREWLSYTPAAGVLHGIAPTESDPSRGGLLQGVVHDGNSAILGGVAAQAGLFGRAGAVGDFAASVLRSFRETTWLAAPDVMRLFATRRSVPGSSRALGWDTMLPTSSCGTRLSRTAIGHTGFTGTSLWIDWERNLYAVLLTNRVHPTRENRRFLPYRAKFHDAVMEDLSAELSD